VAQETDRIVLMRNGQIERQINASGPNHSKD